MNNDPIPKPIPFLPFNAFVSGLGDPTRWRILHTLAPGEPLMVIEIAAQLGRPAGTISKHLAKLRAAGLVISGRGKLYRIPSVFLQTPGLVDFGHCQLPVVPPVAPVEV